jgi:hypothetical protein
VKNGTWNNSCIGYYGSNLFMWLNC